MRRSNLTRATALVLSWVMSATSVWALAPLAPPPPIVRGLDLPPAFALPAGWGTDAPLGNGGAGEAEPVELGEPSALSAVETAWSDDHHGSDHHHHHQGCDHDHDSHDNNHYDDDDDPPDSCHRALRPILECVVANGGSSYTAHFGYDNDGPAAVTIPVGTKNKFTPSPSGRGQPTVFPPGRTPAYPHAAFSVPFNGSNLVWTLQGADHQARTATASSSSLRCAAPPPPPPPPTPCAVSLFGPQKYTRTTGSPNVFTATIAVPSWVNSPFTLKVVNGAANGSNRVSSATIKVNNVQVAGPSDFNQNVAGFERSVTLAPQTTLKVTLSSSPGSYLTLSLCAGKGDATRPVVNWTTPAPGSTVGTATPALLVKYQDLVGANEPAASGVDTTSLQVWLDGVDRTALFTRRSSEASADLPAALALAGGPHRLRATIRDVAGNSGEGTADFTVDVADPTITIVQPLAGVYLPTTRPTIRIQYADNLGLDLATFQVLVNGNDRTSLFVKGASEAVGTLDAASALPNGAANIQASIKDRATRPGQATRSFNVDTQPPTIVITKPLGGSRHGTSDVEVIVQYHDDQKLDLATFDARLDTFPLALNKGDEGALGHPTGLAEGPHRVTVLVRDAAGNQTPAFADFSVDTAAPSIEVVQPPPGFTINTATPNVVIGYSDPQGVDTSKLKVYIAGTERTSWCTAGPTTANCTIPPEHRLAEGTSAIAAEIRDLTNNPGTTTSNVIVDTVDPTATLVSPASTSNVKQSHPEIQVSYGDGAGSGVDPASVYIFVDGVDRTTAFARAGSGATGTLAEALAEGRHDVQISLEDRAGNEGSGSGWFVVDTVAPQATIVAPAPNGFFKDATPAVEVTFADTGGSGVDPTTVHVFLIADPNPPVDITSLLTAGPDRLTGDLTSVLSDGTYRLQLVVSDRATNTTTVEGGFEIDTVAPSLTVNSPHGFVATATPTFAISYHDDGSGIDLGSLSLVVDGTNPVALAKGTLQASGTLAHPLADGPHSLTASVHDRAGNATQVVEPPFTVDTVAPTAAVTAPADGAYVPTAQLPLTVTYSDPNVGAPTPLASVIVSVDGVDRTAEFTMKTVGPVGPDTAEAILGTPFADGIHSISAEVVDWADHHFVTPLSHFTVDTQAPVVTIAAPEEGSYHATASVTVSGTFTDADPQTTVTCQVGTLATVSGNGFTCAVTLAEGENTVTVRAEDRLHHVGTASRGLKLDTRPPVIAIHQPPNGVATAGGSIEVLGEVHDDSAVTVVVGTTEAVVQGDSFHATVSLGAGPVEHVVATATDAAGNTSETFVDVTIDRAAPVVHVTTPAAEAYLKGPTVEVQGTVTDGSSVMVEVNQQAATVSGSPNAATFSAVVPVVDGRQLIKATAHDAAGNTGSDEIWINVDSVAPTVVITEPAPGKPTRANSIHVAGTASDASPFTLRIEGQVVPVVNGQFAVDVPLPAEGSRTITADAVDAAGNAGGVQVTIIVDRTPPALDVVSPAEGAVLGAMPVALVGTVSDATPTTVIVDSQAATRTGDAWQAAVGGLPEGAHTFTVVATDAAGNVTTVQRTVLIDLSAPIVHIITPADGTFTREGTVTVTGEVEDRSAVTVVVDAGGPGQPAVVTGTGPFSFTATVSLADGDSTVTATATDQTSRPGSASVRVTRDSIAPTIQLVTPEKISRGRPGQATVVVTDNLGLGVTFTVKVDGVPVGSFTSSPVVVPLSVPAGKVAGDSFTVSVEASDAAHNTATAQREVMVISDGVIVGQVLVDTTGLPLPGASVHMTSTSGVLAATTDDRGRYSFPTGDAAAIVSVEKAGMTAVERELTIASGTGTVPVDARPTLLADPKTIVPDGGSLTAGTLTVTVGAGAGGAYRLTPLSPQGLPGLLPMGWSPLAAFYLVVPANGGALRAAITGLPALATSLVEYRPTLHDWVLVAPVGTPGSGPLTLDLPGPGSFALVTADGDAVPLPAAVGDVLTGVAFQMLPAAATSTSVVTPATLPPSGGIARGALQVISPTPLPSGTVLQAQVKETFTLSSGEVASEEQRRQDIVLFAHPAPAEAALAAEIPITPSRTFTTTELVEGKVHLDILAGRESVRGKTGGREAVQIDSGDIRLGLAKQSLPDDTAVAVDQSVLSPFVPSSPSLVPVGEAVVDFAGQRLAFAAELSLADPGVVSPGDTLLVARVERVDGIPRLVVVALAELSGGRVRTIATPPLPGLREEGRYVFYRSAVPIGFVSGLVTPVNGRALVEMVPGPGPTPTPFIALTAADGNYLLAVAAGLVKVRARLLKTALAGDASATVEAGGHTPFVNIALVGSVINATVSPASGALVAPNSQLTLSVNTALDPSKITAANIQLKKTATSAAVALRFVLSGSGKTLTIVPTPPQDAPENAVALEFSTDYTLEASGLKTALGGDVLVPTVNFRTKDDTPPVYNTNALTFSFPDADGNVTVKAPAGSFAPGSQILVLNAMNGVVVTFSADNDGAVGVIFPATLPATINDRLIVSITDPLGNTTSFERSKFVNPVTGETAIGPGGGTIEGVGGVEMRIPEGAVDKGVTLKIAGVTAEDLAQLFPNQKPDIPGATLGSGLKIESEAKPNFKKEVKLAFPLPSGLPASPGDAFYYVYRRVTGPDGKVFFETIDHAFVECPAGQTTCPAEEKKVVTASYPFGGYVSSFGSFDPGGGILGAAIGYAFLMWSFDSLLPGRALPGAITGKVLRTKWEPGAATPTYEPIRNAVVRGQDVAGNDLSVTQKDGTFTMFDPRYTGGTVTIQATVDGVTRTATAFEANPADWNTSGLRFYRNIASANITFPPVQPPPPPPDIQIRVLRLVNGVRTDTGGLVVANTPLVIGFTAKDGDVRGATLQGADYGVRIDPLRGQAGGMDFLLDPDYTPAQPGSYTVTAAALPAFGPAVTASYTFRVLADGGGVDNLPGDAPAVITAKTAPKAGATGVPVDTFVQVAFTEPVRRIPGNVRLLDPAGAEAAIRISGVGPGPTVIDDLTSPDSVVTSLTIQPLTGLLFGTKYRLVLGGGIEDLDTDGSGNPAPKTLADAPVETSFTTFGPQALTEPGTGETFASPGLVVLGDRAYLVQNNFFNGTLRAFDVTDPVSPQEIPSARAIVTWRPVDIAGEEETAISQGRLVTIATGPTNRSTPSNVYLFDTTSDLATRWIGAVSLTNSAIDGYITRIVTRDGLLYATTARKGIQVVDLAQAKSLFAPPGSSGHFRMVQSFNTDGQGFAEEAVVQTIRVDDATTGLAVMLRDLKVGDFVADGQSQPLIVATGDAPLVVANPQSGEVLARTGLTAPNSSKLTWGQAVALGTIADNHVAVVVGNGMTAAGASAVLAVVNLNDPRSPQVMSILAITGITGAITDVILKGTLALVGTNKEVALVSLQDPLQPTMAGVLQGAGGRLAFGDNNILLSTFRSVLGGNDPLGGVRTAALGTIAVVKRVGLAPVVAQDGKAVISQNVPIDFTAIGARDVTAGRIEITKNGSLLETLPATMTGSSGTVVWPAGREVKQSDRFYAQPIVETANGELRGFNRQIVPTVVDLDVDSTNTKDKADPVQTDAEDDGEDITGIVQRPGKVAFTNNGDKDGDGIPDFADGTELFVKTKDNVSERFVPMIVQLPAGLDPATTRVKLAYSASDPRSIQRQGTKESGYTYVPAPGTLRVWTKNGDKARNAASVVNGGDYVPPNLDINATVLGTPVKAGTYRLFVEALDYSRAVADQAVKVEAIFADASGAEVRVSDQVRLTVLEHRLVQPDLSNNITPAKGVSFSHPSPTITLTESRITNVRLSDDATRILGDVVLVGRVSCAVCDYTPGDLGKIDGVRVFVNDTTAPVATLGVAGPKAYEAPSLLKPFAFDGSFSGTVPGVELQRGSNLIRVDAADKVYGVTGFSEVSAPLKEFAPPVVVVDYRVSLDFGGATSLAELTDDTPVHLTVVNKAQSPEARFEGDVFKTSDQPLTFRSADATVIVRDPTPLEAGLSPTAIGAIDVDVQVPTFVPAFLVYRVEETTAASSLFGRPLLHVELTLTGPLNDSAPDTVQVLVDDGAGPPTTMALVETGSDTRTFAAADGTFTLRIPAAQPLGEDGWLQVAVSSTTRGLSDLALNLQETGSGTFATDDTTEIGPEDRGTLVGWQFEPDVTTPGPASTGGEFKPFMMQLRGPDDFLAQMSSIETADGSRVVRKAFDGNYYVFMKNSPPGVYIWLPAAAGPAALNPPSQEEVDASIAFFVGYVEGFLVGGWQLVEGTFQLAGLAFLETLRTSNPLGWAYVMKFGDRYKSEKQFARSAVDLATMLAKLSFRLQNDEFDLKLAVVTGNEQSILAISAPYALAFEFGVEFLGELAKQYANDPPETQGYILGRAVFEIFALIVPFTKAAEAGQLTKLGFLRQLKARPFFQNAKIAAAFERIAGFMEDLQVTKMCFVAGTKVHTDRGLKNIEDIRHGDRVLSRDPRTQAQTYKPVATTVVTHPSRLFHVRYRTRCSHGAHHARRSTAGSDDEGDEGDEVGELVATAEHPFFVVGRKEFVPAEELRLGDMFALAGGGQAEVVELQAQAAEGSEAFTTYNLEVEDFHTYFVGPEGVWVHNAGRAFCERLKSLFEIFLKRSGNDVWAAHARASERFDSLIGADSVLARDGVGRVQMYREALRRYFTDLAGSTTAPPWRAIGQKLTKSRPVASNSQMAAELAENMDVFLGVGKPKGFAAHHIVPPGYNDQAGNAERLRQLLASKNIHLNECANGIYLPQTPAAAQANPALGPYHPSLHSKDYMAKLWNRLSPYQGESANVLRDQLQKVAHELASGVFP